MSKSKKILGWINVVLTALWLALVVINAQQLLELSKGPEVTAFDFAPTAIVVISAVLNGYLAYMLLSNNKNKLSMLAHSLLTFSPLFWFVLLFVGSFVVTNIAFPLMAIGLVVGLFIFLRKKHPRLALFHAVITFVIVVVVLITAFEEDYCWGQGTQMDPSGTQMITATEEDAQALSDFEVTAGQQIGVSFREHMLCHNTFDWGQAVKESYLFIK